MDIPTKLVKEFGYLLSGVIASSVNKGSYVNSFEKAEVRPVYKKDGRTEKSNYRPITIL